MPKWSFFIRYIHWYMLWRECFSLTMNIPIQSWRHFVANTSCYYWHQLPDVYAVAWIWNSANKKYFNMFQAFSWICKKNVSLSIQVVWAEFDINVNVLLHVVKYAMWKSPYKCNIFTCSFTWQKFTTQIRNTRGI